MSTVYRKTYTQPLPKNTQIVERNGQKMAMWVDGKGRKHFDQITTGNKGQTKIIRYSPTYLAQFRDSDGRMVIQSTGCRDEQAAKHVLAELIKRVEHVKAGIISTQQCRTADHAKLGLHEHIDTYLEHLQAKTVRGKRVSVAHRINVKRQLEKLINDCKFKRLIDITRDSMERWMNNSEKTGMGARTRNTYRAAIVGFANWCVETDRMAANPLSRLCAADEHADKRKQRRALTEEELNRLFTAAKLRPLAEYGRKSLPLPAEKRKGHKSWHKEPLVFEKLEELANTGREVLKDNPDLISEMEWLGYERSLIYKVLALTGLRKSELASITIGQVWLNTKQPYLELKAKDEKAGRGAQIPLRNDLASEIKQYMKDKLLRLQNESKKKENAIPAHLPAALPLFDMPDSMVGIFDRDIAAAGIAKEDERGRTLDVHALRHTFGTHLSKAGVAPRVAQAAMRHSSIHLTMTVYTDPSLLDVAGAINALPKFQAASTNNSKIA
ncbi:MAG: site-specific tyrosine recombinase XerC [Planctomycetes bacterium ADurb.Bin401]|nr:MAG: site-specific tyrosine recombinase XerC [Planctomycetes bacterium ADurb.Bin401]